MADIKNMAESIKDFNVQDVTKPTIDSILEGIRGEAKARKSSADTTTDLDMGGTGWQPMVTYAEKGKQKAKDSRSNSLTSTGIDTTGKKYAGDGKRPSMVSLSNSIKEEARGRRSSSLPFTGCLQSDEELNEQEETAAYEEAFAILDADGNGEITKDDLHAFIKEMNINIPESNIQDMICTVDVDGNGSINFAEFYRLMMEDQHVEDSAEDMVNAFQVFDEEHQGFLNVEELSRIMLELGEPITEEELADLIHEIDQDHDGLINYNEFIRVMRR